jgi:thymidylate synthase
MNQLDKEYQMLLEYILGNGVEKKDRTGTGTLSVFGWQIRHKMSNGFPLLTTKKMAWKTMVTELLWFLRGDTNIKYLVDNGCNIWNGDAYKNYLKEHDPLNGTVPMEDFIALIKQNEKPIYHELGELGPIYGKQWRSWTNYPSDDWLPDTTDQIQNLINDLKTNPDSRRLMVSAWNVGELDQMVLPPCHYGFQVYTRELSEDERNEIRDMQYFKNSVHQALKGSDTKIDWENIPTRAISLMWNQRSVDTFLGLPFNIASYGLLLEIIAKAVNMVPDELIGNLGDTHLYLNHIEQANEQIDREPFELPTLKFSDWYMNANEEKHSETVFDDWVLSLKPEDFILENYQSHPTIKAPLSN